jgi:DNA invertase Pin-like site-specific DNA recombinase
MPCAIVHKSQIVHKTDKAIFIGLAVCIIHVHNTLDMKYGYARVSTNRQSVVAQVEALIQAGAEKVFREKVSGAVTHRQQLKRTLDALDEGDVLLVTRLDRLARSTRDLLNTLALIAERKAGSARLATSGPTRRLLMDG